MILIYLQILLNQISVISAEICEICGKKKSCPIGQLFNLLIIFFNPKNRGSISLNIATLPGSSG